MTSMNINRQERDKRVQETAEALAHSGGRLARAAMRKRYNWSDATWFRYQARAYELMRSTQPCVDDIRTQLVEGLQAVIDNPKTGPHTQVRAREVIAKLVGAYAPTLSTITVDAVVDHRVQAALICLTDAEARARALALNTAALPLAAPRSLPDALGARLEPDLPSSPE